MEPWIQRYVERGFRLVFYPTKQKGPTGPDAAGWNERTYHAVDWRPGLNIGVLLGHEIQPGKFLVDVDFDWAEGLPLARRLLPATNFGFGRASRPISHAFYTTSKPLISRTFDDINGKPFVELRGTKKDGSLGFQTMVPPSVHPTEEVIELRSDGEITHADDIERRATLYAIGCMLLAHLGHRGLLHDTRLALSGFLLQTGLSEEETVAIGQAVAEATGNNVADVEVTVHSTLNQIKRGERVQGYGALAEAIGSEGKKVLTEIRKWLGESEFITGKKGDILPNNQANIARAVERMGMQLSFDEFRQQPLMKLSEDSPLVFPKNRVMAFEDSAAVHSWLYIERTYHFKPSKEFYYDVTQNIARENPVHPVKEYLDSLTWDGTPRLDNWLITYFGAADTEYVQAVGSLVLLAAVRRIRQPGCKFDEMLVLESSQGLDKSSALAALCPDPSWFSDDLPLDVEAKEIIERTTGKWIIEAAELQGMRPSAMEHLKALLSRGTDGPVRKAYGRLSVEQPRQFIIIGTTNSYTYLTDFTGNRRFWPVRVASTKLKQILADRDQLWAEASKREAEGASIRLAPHLWNIAGKQQERRRSEDPWENRLMTHFDGASVRLAPDEIWECLGIPTERRDERGQRRVSQIMQQLGFRRMSVKNKDGKVVKGWAKGEGKRDPYLIGLEQNNDPFDE